MLDPSTYLQRDFPNTPPGAGTSSLGDAAEHASDPKSEHSVGLVGTSPISYIPATVTPDLLSLLDRLPGIVFTAQMSLAGTFTYTYFSKGCEAITGYSAVDLLANRGELFSQLWYPNDLQQILTTLATAAPELEYRIVNRKGELRWLKQWVMPIATTVSADVDRISSRQVQGFITDITDLKQATLALSQSETKWRALIQNSSDIITIISATGKILYESPSALERLLGYQAHERLGQSCFELVHPEDVPHMQEAFALGLGLAHPGQLVTVEFRCRHKNGSWRYLEATGTNLLDHPDISGIVVNARDISDFKRAERTYQSMFESAQEGIFQTSIDGHFLSANPALAKIYGYASPEELQTEITNIGEQLYVNPETRQHLTQLIVEQGMVNQFESQAYRRDGSIIWITENVRAVFDDDGQLICFEGTVQDISERKQAEATIRYQAFHDLLTGLPNRMLFDDRLAQAFAQAQRCQEAAEVRFAVIFLDLDRFKSVNDTHGHGVGDQLLQHVAKRLVGCLRDMDTVCRRGGDEFTLLIPQLSSQEQGFCITERILQAFQSEFMIEEHPINVTCSMGIAFYPQDGENSDLLLRHADDALYKAKQLGRNNYQRYCNSLH
jgi:diguanylate cyclase (GGDEF)-like protein/PAS domain S-box-containing protein